MFNSSIGSSCKNTNSSHMEQESVIMSGKRRREEQSVELCTQSKRLHHCGSQSKQPQSVPICEKNK